MNNSQFKVFALRAKTLAQRYSLFIINYSLRRGAYAALSSREMSEITAFTA